MKTVRERYLECWNETDPTVRARLVADAWSARASYVDPLVEATGHEAITATIGAVQQQFPGHVFTPVGEVDEHHGVARFQWGLGPVGAAPLVVGFDVVTTDEDGRISTVVGFLDQVPVPASA
jgi:hypothetical protein